MQFQQARVLNQTRRPKRELTAHVNLFSGSPLGSTLPNGGSVPYPEPSTSHAHAAPVIRAHSSTLLLLYSLVFVALGRFHRHLGRFNLLGQLLQLAMVGLPVATSVTGFDSSALLQSLAQRVPGYQGLYSLIAPKLGLTTADPGHPVLNPTVIMAALLALVVVAALTCFTSLKFASLLLNKPAPPTNTTSQQVQNVFLNNLGSAAYNNAEKNELFSVLSFAETFFDAASPPLSDVQKVNHVVGQLTGKSRDWFA